MNGKNLAPVSVRYFTLILLSLFIGVALTACGGGSSGSSTPTPDPVQNGEVIIGLTDAEGDFHSYTVDVLSVKLIRQNGAEVETLPLSTRVDFAQYTELTEFLTAATVPNGNYIGASLLVDYSNAEIIVEDDTGNGVEANAVNANGDPLGQLELNVEFVNSDTFRILPGIPAHITLDFDLNASNQVDFLSMPTVVTVDPVLVADTLLEDPKPHRLRGLLNTVTVDEDVFSLYIRPFFHHGGDFGRLRVHSNNATSYDIDDMEYSGHAGVVAMAALAARTPVMVLGSVDRNNHQFIATDVLAGSSVPWGEVDMAAGNVIARNGDTLTLSHVSRHRHDNQVRHQQLITVLLGTDTQVSQQGSDDPGLDTNAISVGQRVLVTGEFTDDLTLDATNGRVRMQFTHLSGNTVSVTPLVADLQAIDRRRVRLFDFTGTGFSEDADPDNYEIDTGSLSLGNLMPGEPLRIIGHVRPFGGAPADFSAQTVIALGNLPATLLLNWDDGTAPFVSQSDNAIVIGIDANAFGNIHKILQAGIATDILNLSQDPTLIPNNSGQGIFILTYQGRTRLYMHFENFSQALADLLDGANALVGLNATGSFDASTVTLTAKKIVARVR